MTGVRSFRRVSIQAKIIRRTSEAILSGLNQSKLSITTDNSTFV